MYIDNKKWGQVRWGLTATPIYNIYAVYQHFTADVDLVDSSLNHVAAPLDDFQLFPRDVELHFADAYDKLLRAVDGLETSRDLVAGVRDYFQSKIANDQNEVVKRLTVIASVLLLPTFIVGLYGQNFRHHFPEIHWQYGYVWSWALIIAATIAQFVWFRRRRWI